jgi:uncharacterized membrane protein YphA (DoxX/SURF4 family)
MPVQVVLGYEWFVSGLTKLVRGGFPQGLADELREMSHGAPGWYKDFLASVVLPRAQAFGYAIEVAGLAAGAILIATAVGVIGRHCRRAWSASLRLPRRCRPS